MVVNTRESSELHVREFNSAILKEWITTRSISEIAAGYDEQSAGAVLGNEAVAAQRGERS